MDQTIKYAIGILKAAITGEPGELPRGAAMKLLLQLFQNQSVVAMGYVGAVKSGLPEDTPPAIYLADLYCLEMVTSERQMALFQQICDAFENAGIEYMPVKGTIMKRLYPDHAMRKMTDADILIREEQYEKICPIMRSLGFTEAMESDHEHIWMQEFLKVELHKHLIPSYKKDLYCYFGTGWDLAKIQDGCRWAMTQEDAFIYNFIHFAKHYRDGEGHCRFVVDIWVHMRSYPDMDKTYIRSKLQQMKMEIFYDNIMRLIDCWFGDGQWDNRMEKITSILFCADGQDDKQRQSVAQNAQQAGSVKETQKLRRLRRIFPDREHMDWSYPQWKKKPLVVAWCLRWWDLLVNRRDVLKKRAEENTKVTEQEVENYRKDLEYVGLQYADSVALPD